MTKDDIIRMAREAGIGWLERAEGISEFLERFASLVAAAEPEVGVCCQEFDNCLRSCTPRGQWTAHKAAQSEWQGLTDADIAQTMRGSVEGSNMLPYQFARAIEAKLKEKNHD